MINPFPSRTDYATLELLAPAKNAEFGKEAINHGADAVYIGGPQFGARAHAGNPVADIAALANHAHKFGARVYVALNTILTDAELEPARDLAWQVYDAGADGLILQDMGLLELDLPPLALHASTQTDNRTVEKVKFLEQVGFSQIVLARELALTEITAIAQATTATLEFFVHGALCVSYSGQCYISHAHTGRSANRGECSQACRLPYDVIDTSGLRLARKQHVLSLKDNHQADNLPALAAAGIRSFKIEGRLKDLAYVKNITAYYRQTLDRLLDTSPHYQPASAGRCTYPFVPRPEKTFNRGSTDYFVHQRQPDIAEFASPKFAGEAVGRVARVHRDALELETACADELHNGDGLSYYRADGELDGFRVNRVEQRNAAQWIFFPAPPPGLAIGTLLYRNHDQAFLRQLDKTSAQRKIGAHLQLTETSVGFALEIQDEQGYRAVCAVDHPKQTARNGEQALAALRETLGKLGNTLFRADHIAITLSAPWFVPLSLANHLRRTVLDALETARITGYCRPPRAYPATPPPRYPQTALSYLGNVSNHLARAFYTRHGVTLIDAAYECGPEHGRSPEHGRNPEHGRSEENGEVALMITKHCLRYSFQLCPKQHKGIHPDPLILRHGQDELTLRFDCKRCEMSVIGRRRVANP